MPALLHKEIVLQRLFLNTSSREQFVRLRSEKLKMQRTCCSLYTRAARWAAAAYDCMPMCIGSFSYTRSRLASLARFLFVGQSDVRRTWLSEWEPGTLSVNFHLQWFVLSFFFVLMFYYSHILLIALLCKALWVPRKALNKYIYFYYYHYLFPPLYYFIFACMFWSYILF